MDPIVKAIKNRVKKHQINDFKEIREEYLIQGIDFFSSQIKVENHNPVTLITEGRDIQIPYIQQFSSEVICFFLSADRHKAHLLSVCQASSIALPISCLMYLFSNVIHSAALYALALACFRSAPFAVTPRTRPPFVTIPFSVFFVPAWKQ